MDQAETLEAETLRCQSHSPEETTKDKEASDSVATRAKEEPGSNHQAERADSEQLITNGKKERRRRQHGSR